VSHNIGMNAQTWAEARRLKEIEHCTVSEISRRLGKDRKTIRRALSSAAFPKRAPSAEKPSKLDAYKPYIHDRLKEYPQLAATRIFEEIKKRGYPGRMRIVWEYIARLRARQREAFLRIETQPGEYAQVDWAHCGTVRIGTAQRKLSCFVMVLGYSRLMYAEFTLSQCIEDFIRCHINAFHYFGGITRKLLYDNLKTVVLSRLGRDVRFNPAFMEFAGTYLFEPVACNPSRGNEKGKVESGIKYIRSGFLEGRAAASWPGINEDMRHWLESTANARQHATVRTRPCDRFELEKPALQKLPDRDYDASIIRPVKATSQARVHFDANTYSVPDAFAYKALILKAGAGEVRIFDDCRQIAVHKRSYERGIAVEDPRHYDALIAAKKKAHASKLKEYFLELGPSAQAYLDGLTAAELDAGRHLAEIMDCVRQYGKTEVLQAISHALEFKAYGAPYLKNIILQQRVRRGIVEQVEIKIPAKPVWTQLCVEEQDLSLYDDMFTEDENEKSE